MDRNVTTYSTLYNLVELDNSTRKVKDLAVLFLNAMNDWPSYNQSNIHEFVQDLKEYFGSPLTVKKIKSKKMNLNTAHVSWKLEACCSISEMIEMSTQFCCESNFDKILQNILTYYDEEFSKVDFIAELQYRTTEEGGRSTPALSGYRPQVKFDFAIMESSGQQTFIGKDFVNPGETINAKIKILSPDFYAHQLQIGMMYKFKEGPNVIGTGKILEIVNDKLEKTE